ncbi:MAG: hypothetical protein FWC83_00430 [Alphaproteobacteria bacterium]|nr:hypothetical protein [Alphaproteobacteria bacterium]
MKKLLTLSLTLTLALAACEFPRERIYLTCGEDTAMIRVYSEKIIATINDETFKFRGTETGTGTRFLPESDITNFMIWRDANDWALITIDPAGDMVLVSCYE